MKKKIFFSLSILALLILGLTVFQSSKLVPASEMTVKRNTEHNTPEQLQLLQKLGFKNSKNLNLGEAYDGNVHADDVLFYSENFGMKYFSEDGVERYCAEHDLIIGNAEDFRGSFPIKNIQEIDSNSRKLINANETGYWYYNDNSGQKAFGYIPESNIRPEAKKFFKEGGGNNWHFFWLGACIIKDKYSEKFKDKYGTSFLRLHRADIKFNPKTPIKTMVIAPKEDFNTEGKKIKDGYRLAKADPIILAVVGDGYVVLTRWFE